MRGSLLGRAGERAAVSEALACASLVTLVGAPGIGKTRLARAVAGDDPGASVVVELASVSDPSLVESALAAALDVQATGGISAIEAIVADLGHRRLLLVLDNCEHLLGACARAVTALLGGCPSVRVLATSRQPLSVEGELVWQVPPLRVPAEGETDVDALIACPAVALFAACATAVWPRFALNAFVADDVANICRRLDGIPLAIELAAARVVTMTPREIARHLEDQIGLPGDADLRFEPRHRTLMSAIDWSHALLSDSERSLLHCLSVFVGTFELEAVVAVCGGWTGSQAEIPELLARLVSKSLVVATGAGGRFRLLETIRAYAAKKLEQDYGTADLRTAHARFFVGLAERAERELAGPSQLEWFARIAAERPNLRAALEWSLGCGRGEWALRLTGALVLYWRVRGPYAEGRELLGLALSADADDVTELRAKALWGAGFLAQMAGDESGAVPLLQESLACYRAARDDGGCARVLLIFPDAGSGDDDPAAGDAYLDECVRLARRAGDPWCLAHALGKRALRARDPGEWAAAGADFTECLAVARGAGDLQGLRYGLIGLGGLRVDCGDYAEAEALLAEAVEVTAALGETYDQAVALTSLGKLALGRGQYARAATHLREALALLRVHEPAWAWHGTRALLATVAHAQGDRPRARSILDEVAVANPDSVPVALGYARLAVDAGDLARARELLEPALRSARGVGVPQATARVLHQLALLARLEGHLPDAATLHDEALGLQYELAELPAIAQTLEGAAGLAAAADHHEHAARMFGAAEAIRERDGYARLPWDAARYDADLRSARAGLPAQVFRRAYAEGAAMTAEQAVAAAVAGPRPSRAASGWPSLTERELEIAWLVADGLSNPKIADRLVIARETVKKHLVNIYAKLGVDGRWMLAREAEANRISASRRTGRIPHVRYGGFERPRLRSD